VNEPTCDQGQRGVGHPIGEPAPIGRVSNRFLDALRQRPLVLDAGIGTRLIELGLNLRDDDPSLWNLTHGAHVLAIHRRDVAAGADAILTNTFGANRCWMSKFGREAEVETINRRAVELARLAVRPEHWVIGDLGPAAASQAGAAAEQAAILVDSGVDALILETYLAESAAAVLREVRATVPASVPILVSLREWPARWPDFEGTARRLLDLGASVLGINCQPDINAAVAFAERMNRVVSCPLLVKPGVYPLGGTGSDPSLFTAAVPALLASNVRLLGGCCGTTHLHVAALAASCAFHNRARLSLRIGAYP
jgi:5-methyltetrahydrofolate--homocysteine methyltransferase